MATPSKPIKAVALDNVDAQRKGDLSFRTGDVVYILNKSSPNIWKGATADGKVGRFLARMVKEEPPTTTTTAATTPAAAPSPSGASAAPLSTSPPSTSPRNAAEKPLARRSMELKAKYTRVVALEDCDSTRAGDLSFKKGDVIFVLAKSTPNIWKGARDGKVGRFLSRTVRELAPEDTPPPKTPQRSLPPASAPPATPPSASGATVSGGSSSPPLLVRALEDHAVFDAQDLAFVKDEVITVTDRSNSGVWFGSIGKRSGKFLARLVAPVDDAKVGGDAASSDNTADAPPAENAADAASSGGEPAPQARKAPPNRAPPAAPAATPPSTPGTPSDERRVSGPMAAAAARERPRSVYLLPTMITTQSEDDFKHNMIANELYMTEASYVQDMEIMQTEFFETTAKLSACKDTVLTELHTCVSQLIPLHKTLCAGLEAAMRQWPKMSLARPLAGVSGGVFLDLYKVPITNCRPSLHCNALVLSLRLCSSTLADLLRQVCERARTGRHSDQEERQVSQADGRSGTTQTYNAARCFFL